jgi:hypothetical protein
LGQAFPNPYAICPCIDRRIVTGLQRVNMWWLDLSWEVAMVQMTLTVSDQLAERLAPLGSWLPTVLELTPCGL